MILKELKVYDKNRKEQLQGCTGRARLRALKRRSQKGSLQRLLKALEKGFKETRNLRSHENLLQDIDRQLKHEGLEI